MLTDEKLELVRLIRTNLEEARELRLLWEQFPGRSQQAEMRKLWEKFMDRAHKMRRELYGYYGLEQLFS